MGGIFFCRVAIFNALGVASGIEMRLGAAPICESVSYAILRVHLYVGESSHCRLWSKHDASTNLARGICLVAASYAAQHSHLPQSRDPGVCDYTPSTDAPTT